VADRDGKSRRQPARANVGGHAFADGFESAQARGPVALAPVIILASTAYVRHLRRECSMPQSRWNGVLLIAASQLQG
jgi:hypothetical protein